MARRRVASLCACLALAATLAACSGGASASQEATSGAAFSPPASVDAVSFDPTGAVTANDGSIDVSHLAQGEVAASATSSARLKFLVTQGQVTTPYDLPSDGTPIVCPLTGGSGTYTFRIMRNTSGDNYVETTSTTQDVRLESDFAPFLRPNIFCDYSDSSACVAKARELVQGAQNQGDAVRSICEFVVANVTYDTDKARQLSGTSGYVPDPDQTLASGTGICFDYASLGCAMLRSQGIPCQLVTGTVSPDDVYHAWIMVYVDGTWQSAQFSVAQDTWSRVDLTFASAGNDSGLVGDGKTYTDRHVY